MFSIAPATALKLFETNSSANFSAPHKFIFVLEKSFQFSINHIQDITISYCLVTLLSMIEWNFLRQACNFIKKETLAQVLSCEFFEISKNTFINRTPLVTASVICSFICQFSIHHCWYYYNQKQSLVVFCKNRCSYRFRKIHKKTPALKTRF